MKAIITCILLLFSIQLFAQDLAKEFAGSVVVDWGQNLPGIKTRIKTNEKVLALTFDACGSDKDGYDSMLIDFLTVQKVPATLFISGRWIDKFQEEFAELSNNSLFEIENHGLNHKPASIDGNIAYGIIGTKDIPELIKEVEQNSIKIQHKTGKKPKFYRSGTAYYDDVAVQIINKLKYDIAGFSILGDAGATYKKEQVKKALLNAPKGSIIIMHMNHPEKETAQGVIAAIPVLKKRGFKFVKLEDCVLY
jgi:peptidoglycan/xylan/chitin deacetylase (PgdA/CDA1 family)